MGILPRVAKKDYYNPPMHIFEWDTVGYLVAVATVYSILRLVMRYHD